MMTLPKACSPKPTSGRTTSCRPQKMSPSPSWLSPYVASVVRRITTVLAFVGLLIPRPVAGAEAKPGEVRVLIVTGIDYPGHKWRETTPVLVEALTHDARLRVDVLEDPYRLDTTDLSPYRAIFLHFMNWEKPDPNDQAKENLRSFVERGGGMVMIHFACGAFQDWPEFQNLAGRIYDRTNTHDPRGPFTVEITKTSHAITRGMTSFGVDDELYICLAGEKPIDVLATARSKVTQRDHPMAFVHSYGKGRVFQTPLGHDVKALRSGRTLELIRGGTLWVAGLENDSRPKENRVEIERTLKLPPGFSAQLIAAEPDIMNPMFRPTGLATRDPDVAPDLLLTLRTLGVESGRCDSLPFKANTPTTKSELMAAVLARLPIASATLGRLSFHSARAGCAKGHSLKPGESPFGPSLAEIGAASQPEDLVESILEPGRGIKTGFQTETIETNDGRVLSGLVEASGSQLLVNISPDEQLTVPLRQVKNRAASHVSPMPEGLEASMSEVELADLVAYLQSLRIPKVVPTRNLTPGDAVIQAGKDKTTGR